MSDVKLVGSVGIKVRPVSKGFRREAERQIKQDLAGADATVPVKAELKEESKRRLKGDVNKTVREAEAEARTIELEVKANHASIARARAQLKALDDDLKTRKAVIEVEVNREGLAKARRELDEFAARNDRVKIKYRNDEQGLKDAIAQTKRYLRELLPEYEVKTKFDKDSLEKQLKTFEDRLARVQSNRTIEFNYRNDRNGLEKVIKEIDDRISNMDAITVPVKDNPKALEKLRQKMQKEFDSLPLEIPMHLDADGWDKLITELKARKRDLENAAKFVVEPDELRSAEGMQRAIERARAQAKAAGIHVEIEYDNDVASVSAALAELRKRLKDFSSTRVRIDADLDERQIREKITALQAERHNMEMHLEISDDTAGLLAAREAIAKELDLRKPKIHIDVRMDNDSLRRELLALDEELMRRRVVKINLEGETAARAKLAALARDRVSTIFIKTRDLTAFSFAKLTGLRAATRWAEEFGLMLGRLDRNLPIVAAVTMGVAQLSSGILALGSNIFTLGTSLAQIGYLGLLGPALLGGLISSMVVMTGVFKDFGAALNGDDRAMKRLTASGQQAVNAIRPVFQEMREGMSKQFWGEASDAMLRFSKDALPAFSKGFTGLAGAMGRGFGGVIDAFNDFARRGGIQTQFGLLSTGFDLASKGAADFWNAINTLGAVGARIFPRLGSAFTNMGEKFDNWVQRIVADGTLTAWINRGIRNLQDLGRVLVNMGQVWGNFAKAAEAAGGATLGKLADGLQHLEDITGGTRFQRNMQTIFEGAHDSMGIFGRALGDLSPQMDQFSATLKNLLTGAATALGSAIRTIGDVLGSPAVDSGFKAFLGGLDSMFKSLRPSAENVASIIGTLGDVLGTVATDAGPLFREVFRQLDGVFQAAWASLKPFIPELIGLGVQVISTVGPALTDLAEAVLPAVGRAFQQVGPIITFVADAIKGLSSTLNSSSGTGHLSLDDQLAEFFKTDQSKKEWAEARTGVHKNLEDFWGSASDASHDILKNLGITNLFPSLEVEYQKKLQERIRAGSKGAEDELEAANRRLQQIADDASIGTSGLNADVQAWADHAKASAARLMEAERAVKTLGDTSLDASSKIDAMNASLRLLNGGEVSERDALSRQITNMERFKAEAQSLRPALEGVKDSLIGADGLLNIKSGNTAIITLRDTMRSAADDVKITAKAAYDAAIKNNSTVQEAVNAATEAVKKGHGNLQEIADAAGVDVATLEAEWSTFFGKDWTLFATFTATTDRFEAARQVVEAAGMEFDGKEFQAWLMADGNPANETVEMAKAHAMTWVNGQWQARMDALPEPAQSVLAGLLDRVDTQWRRGDFEATMRAAQNIPGLPGVIAQLLAGRGPYDAAFYAQLDPASYAAVSAALFNLANQQRVAEITVMYTEGNSAPGTSGGGLRHANANGGLYMRNARVFANGGFSFENHVAQIARPGVVPRVWAEAETGGEAYIPYAVHKRQRSTHILSRVASDFGYQLVRKYADGGSPAGGPSYNAPVHIGTLITTDPDEAVRTLQQKRRDSLAVNRIR